MTGPRPVTGSADQHRAARGDGDRLRALFATVLVEDRTDAAARPVTARRTWRRHTVAEAGEYLVRRARVGMTRAELQRLLDDARVGRVRVLPTAVRTGLASFFGVPGEYFRDERVAVDTDAALLDESFARLGITAVVLCRASSTTRARRNQLLRVVLDSAITER